MARDLTAKIKLEADTREAKREFATFKREILASIDAISSTEAEVDVDTSEGEANLAKLEDILKGLDALEVSPEVDVDTKAADKSLDGLIADFKKLDGTSVSPTVTVDSATADADLSEVQGKLSELDSTIASPKVKALTAEADSDLLAVQGKLSEIDATQASASVTVDAKPAVEGLDDVEKAADSTGASLASIGVKALAAVGGVAAFTAIVKAAFAAALLQEDAIVGLNSALFELGSGRAGVVSELLDQSKSLQEVTKFSQGAIIDSQKLVAQFVKEADQIKEITRLSLDFATARGVSLSSSAEIITRTFASSSNALQEYGISVEGVAGSTARLVSLTAGLDRAFGNAAIDGADSFSGKLTQLNNELRDTLKLLAENATKSDDNTDAASRMTRNIAAVNVQLENQESGFKDVLIVLGSTISALLEGSSAAEGFKRTINSATGAVGGFIGPIEELKEGMEGFIGPLTLVTDALQEQQAVLDRVLPEEAKLEARLRSLGIVTRESLVEALSLANEALEDVRQGYRQNRVTLEQLREAELGVAEAEARLRGEMLQSIEVTNLASKEGDEFTEVLLRQQLAIDGVASSESDLQAGRERSVETLREEIRLTNELEASQNLLGGESEFAQISGGQFNLPPGVEVGPNGRVRVAAGPSFRGITISG